MKYLFRFLSLLLILQSKSTFAKNEFEIFSKNWEHPSIESSYCGKNSQLFVHWLYEQKIDLTKTQLWQITNKGFDYFGLVKYYQNRWTGFIPSPVDPTYLTNGSGGWHYHAFVVHNGMVYDYSYKQKPTVVPLKDYLLDMFTLKHDVGPMFWEKRRDSLEMIKKYEVIAINGNDVIRAEKEKLRLSDFEYNLGYVAEHTKEEATINKLVKKMNILPMTKLKFVRARSCDDYFSRPNPMIIPQL